MPNGPLFYVLFWGVFLISLGFFAYRFRQLWQYLMLGQPESTAGRLKQTWDTLVYILTQLCQLKNFRSKDRAPLGHAMLVWGFFASILFYFFFIIISEGLGAVGLQDTQFYYYFTWIMDFMAALVFIGAAWAMIRRYIVRPDRLKGEQTWESFIILFSVLTHPITHWFEIGTKIALGESPAGLGHTALPPISNAISQIFTGNAALEGWHTGFFWAHWMTVVLVLILIPYTRYMHIVASPFNGILRNPRRMGAIKNVDVEKEMEKPDPFASKADTLTWKQNLDLYSCVVCGNCQELCPAYGTGKPLNPKKVIRDLKNHLLKVGPQLVTAKAEGKPAAEDVNVALPGNIITEDEIWSCTTCGACDTVCPVWVDHIDKIIDMRRNLVMAQSIIPDAGKVALDGIEKRGHPWRGTTKTRTDWTEGLNIKSMAEDANVDVLYWVGCTSALEDRSIRISRAFATVMQQAGVKFGILADEETCCGDPARRLGNEYLYQMQAQQNIEIIKNYKVKKVVTACPHCYNTLKNEYPEFGADFEVLHHTEFIGQLLKEGRIKAEQGDFGKITYHDSCYLGRHNQIYDGPRDILKSLPGAKLVEMERNHKRGFCCGGGGGRMWLEEKIGTHICEARMDQIIETKAGMVATACPYCLQMFDDAAKAKQVEEKIKVKDIAELIVESSKPK
jgi:Fe-S oxidoreductase